MADGALIILDGGTGLRAMGARLEAAPASPAGTSPLHLFLSHRHSDHVIGLPHFAPLFSNRREVRLAGHSIAPDALREFVAAMLAPPLFPSVAGVLERTQYPQWDAVDGISVSDVCRVRRLDARHPDGASVITVEDEAGLLLAYAPDNELGYASDDPQVETWRVSLATRLAGVPLLLHDATYTDAELAQHHGWGHSSVSEATQFAVACRAERLLLFHHHPDRQDDELTQLATTAAALARSMGSPLQVDAASEGSTLLL